MDKAKISGGMVNKMYLAVKTLATIELANRGRSDQINRRINNLFFISRGA